MDIPILILIAILSCTYLAGFYTAKQAYKEILEIWRNMDAYKDGVIEGSRQEKEYKKWEKKAKREPWVKK